MSHKLREAMAAEVKGYQLGGEGKVVEVDGGYFGGYVKPANHQSEHRSGPSFGEEPKRQSASASW